MTFPDEGLGPREYAELCEAVSVEPRLTSSPRERAAHLPRWLRKPLIATINSRRRLHEWVNAGRPEPSERDIALGLRFTGHASTLTLIRQCLNAGAIAAPAIWHLLERVTVLAIGRDAIGICSPAPQPNVERMITIIDIGADQDVISLFLHELAHAVLLPRPLRDLTRHEEALVCGPEYMRTAAVMGVSAEVIKREICDEVQACTLAAAWGATGHSADATYCTRVLRTLLLEDIAR